MQAHNRYIDQLPIDALKILHRLPSIPDDLRDEIELLYDDHALLFQKHQSLLSIPIKRHREEVQEVNAKFQRTNLCVQVIEESLEFQTAVKRKDYASIPLYPEPSELLNSHSCFWNDLPINITEGKYGSVDEYLYTQYALYRADCMASLRDGIKAYLAGKLDDRDMHIYHITEILGIHFRYYNFDLC